MYHYEDAMCTKMITVQVVFAKLLPEGGSSSGRRASNKGKSIFTAAQRLVLLRCGFRRRLLLFAAKIFALKVSFCLL